MDWRGSWGVISVEVGVGLAWSWGSVSVEVGVLVTGKQKHLPSSKRRVCSVAVTV